MPLEAVAESIVQTQNSGDPQSAITETVSIDICEPISSEEAGNLAVEKNVEQQAYLTASNSVAAISSQVLSDADAQTATDTTIDASVQYGQINGSIAIEEEGQQIPVSGVSIMLYSVDELKVAAMCQTDENGLWSTPADQIIVGHTYVVRYAKAGYTFAENNLRYTASVDSMTIAPVLATALEGYVCNEADYIYSVSDSAATITGYTGTDTKIIFPDELDGYPVTSVGEQAFQGKTTLEGVYLSDHIVSIGNKAFEGCSGLVEINLPNTLSVIGQYAFSKCSAASTVELPEAVASIGSYAFSYCAELTCFDYPLGWITASSQIFYQCTKLNHISIPDGVITIPKNAFYSGNAIQSVSIPNSVKQIGGYAFSDCSALAAVEFTGEGLERIERSAFSGCITLEELLLPDTVTTIGISAFSNCRNLCSFGYPLNLVSMEMNGFRDCDKLDTITIPEGVTTIPAEAFRRANKLKHIVLPSTLTTIEGYAFYECEALETVNFPDSLKTIAGSAFAGCVKLKEIDVSATYIGDAAFHSCTALSAVTFTDRVESIGSRAFFGCTALAQVSVPDSVKTVGEKAFQDCTALTEVHFGKGLQTIGNYAFWRCAALKSVTFGEGLQSVGEYAFAGCTGLSSASFYDQLRTIGGHAFSGCTSLSSVSFSDGLQTIGDCAFEKCSFSAIEVPDSVTTLGQGAFRNCANLTSFRCPSSWTTSPGGLFNGCINLTSIIVPEGVTEIPEYAFSASVALEQVILPESLKKINKCAFRSCDNLGSIYIPDSVTFIDTFSFSYSDKVVFRCYLDSYAASFAFERGIPIVEIPRPADHSGEAIDLSNSFYRINQEGLSASGYLSMVAQYAFRDPGTVKDVSVSFNIPTSVTLMENTLTVNGALCTNYSLENGFLKIPLTSSGGVIRFSLKPKEYGNISAYARITYTHNSKKNTEVLGSVYQELPILTIESKGETSQSTIDVNGVTIPGNQVTLYVNGEAQKTVTANKAGDYAATLQLPEPSTGKKFTLKAETKSSAGTIISASCNIVYRAGAPTLISFVMKHNGQSFTLEQVRNNRPIVTFAEKPFTFVVKFDMVQDIKSVYVVSTRNNIKKYMKAEWDVEQQAYIANGYFDPSNPAYVPGVISVEYVRRMTQISFTADFDSVSDEVKSQIPNTWQNVEHEILEETETKMEAVVQLPDGESSMRFTTEKTEIPEGVTEENAEEYGYDKVVDDDGNVVYVRVDQGLEASTFDGNGAYTSEYQAPGSGIFNVAVSVLDFVGGELMTIGLEAFKLDSWANANDVFKSITDGVGTHMKYEKMREDITLAPYLNASEKEAALRTLGKAQFVDNLATVIAWALLVLDIVGHGNILWLPVIMLGSKLVTSIIENYTEHLMDTMMYNIQEYQFGFRWSVDPSGYVYDADTNERIAGATVTVYWIEYNEDDPNFWDTSPDPDEYGALWDSSEYSQLNPLTTDNDGCYAWDVPEGWWRVKCEHPDYQTTWSQWVAVPPPQTEVNIAMTSIANSYQFEVLEYSDDSIEVRTTNAASENTSVMYVLAGYDSAGQMIAINTMTGMLSSNTPLSLTLYFTGIPENVSVDNVRAFVLDPDTRTPRCGDWSYEVGSRIE